MKLALQELFVEYTEYHRHPVNIMIHKIAVPMIFFNAMAMLDWVVLGRISFLSAWPMTLGHVFVVFCAVWYLAMDVKLGVFLTLSFAGMLALGWVTPGWAVIAIGVFGWTIQMAGHLVWEKKAPNFTKNAIQALVGPIYFLALATGDWRMPAASEGEIPGEAPGETILKGGKTT
jgi:uncharacterized membrane protein YGL010W